MDLKPARAPGGLAGSLDSHHWYNPAAAALMAAAARPDVVHAVISRGGRPDLAGDALPRVEAPTLLIVGGHDGPVIELNEEARRHMHAPVQTVIIPGATHLFEEPGALEQVAQLALEWCQRYLTPRPSES